MEDWEIKALEDEKLALLDELVVLEGFGSVCLFGLCYARNCINFDR